MISVLCYRFVIPLHCKSIQWVIISNWNIDDSYVSCYLELSLCNNRKLLINSDIIVDMLPEWPIDEAIHWKKRMNRNDDMIHPSSSLYDPVSFQPKNDLIWLFFIHQNIHSISRRTVLLNITWDLSSLSNTFHII